VSEKNPPEGFPLQQKNRQKTDQMAKPVRPSQIWERALAGSRWLVQHQNQEGSWKGLSDPKADGFYKSSWALAETGHAASAHRSLTYVRQTFFTPEGDFLPREHPWHIMAHYPYLNSYFIVGSMLTGHYQIAIPAVSFLLTQQDARHGGFYSRLTEEGGKQMADTTSSSMAGIACLAAGKVESAQRVADYLAHMIELQPASNDRFFTAIKADGLLYTDPENDIDAFLRIIDTKKADQCMFAMGLPFAFLVQLADAANDTRYLDLAKWYFNFQRSCIDPWDGYSSGKAGWGCAMLYRITGETHYRDVALHVAGSIINRQRTDGSWLYGRSNQPRVSNADMDLTAEFTLWLSLISANVLARDSGRIPIVLKRTRIPKPSRTQSLKEILQRTARAHYRILKNEGIKKYFLYSYLYRKGQVFKWIRKKF
jgi:hypothetical protein